jgi:uncharacterized repeat protein (TIGR01451 family)
MVSIGTPGSVTIGNSQFNLADVQPEIIASGSTLPTLNRCVAANPGIAGDPTKPLDSGGQNGAQFTVTVTEGFPSAFLPKNIAEILHPGTYPPDQNQNILGYPYNSETGFFNGGTDPTINLTPPVPSTVNFPAVRALNQAGEVDQGTRVYVSFSGVPAGLTLYVPTLINLVSAEPATLGQQTGQARLVSTDSTGSGLYTPVTGNASGLATVQNELAVYEILSSNATLRESIAIPIAAAYSSTALNGSADGQFITARTGLAPFGSASVPRFTATTVLNGLLFRGCNQPDLTTSMTNSPIFPPNGTGSFTLTVTNTGDTPTSGMVTLTDTLPSGLTATAFSGSGWSCNIASLTCTRTDALLANASYPPVTLTVSVAASFAYPAPNSATVSGGGEALITNDTASTTVYPAALQSVTVGTSVAGVSYQVDGFTYISPHTFQWTIGSTHTLATSSPQLSLGQQYVFNNWSDSGAMTHNITVVPSTSSYSAAFTAAASTVQCVANAGIPPLIRQEGRTEKTGDLILNCTGGVPTAAGSPVPQVDIQLTFNTNVTSRFLSPGFNEALLLIDEPHSTVSGATAALLPCAATGTNDNGSGSCSILGNGTGQGVYDGSPGRPNVFQGQPVGTNGILWKGVPVDAPTQGATRILRFTNIRVDDSLLPRTSPLPNQVVVNVAITPGGLALTNPQQTIAFGQEGLGAPASNQPVLAQCLTANPSIAAD